MPDRDRRLVVSPDLACCSAPAWRIAGWRVSGFTLIEVMVVLIVLAIAASSVRHVVSTHLERQADSHVERLRLALQAAADYGLTRGQMLRFELEPGRYRFMLLNLDGSWSPYRGDNRLLQAHDLPEGMQVLALRVEGEASETLLFRSRPPVFDLEGETGNGGFVISGSAIGRVQRVRAGDA